MALYMTVVMGGTPLGSPVIGWIGEHLGARWTLIIGGVLVLVGVGLALLVFRLVNRRGQEAAEPSSRGRDAALGVLTPSRAA